MIDKEKIHSIEKDYKNGWTYKQLSKKYNLTYNQTTYLIKKEKWKRKSNLSKTHIGNTNALGNSGGPGAGKGNKNAVTTGEYENIFSGCFSDEEKTFLEKENLKDKKEEILLDLKILTIRESRMLNRIENLKKSNSDMVINNISKTNNRGTKWDNSTTHTQVENIIIAIQRIEEALTRVQESKRKCLDSLHRMENDDRKLELELIRLEMEASKENNSNTEDLTDDSFIKALNDSAEGAWNDYTEE